jgi:hypothetical protein
MIKNAASVLLTVLQLNQLKHAQQDMGLKPPSPAPERPKTARKHLSLNQTPTETPSTPAAPATPAAEVGKTPEAIAQAAGVKVGPSEPTGSLLMPPNN